MANDNGPVTVLDDAECWALLGTEALGRIVTTVRGELDVFPINYCVDGTTLVFRTAEGTKLLELTINDIVAFEVDHYTDERAWSVVVKGTAHVLTTQAEIAEADRLPLGPWIPTVKENYVRVVPTSVTGRGFDRLAEPERY